ncbi:type III pantothenate kinase [Seonamhaeicola sp. MEBiC1930]|uniref:type III pantothenate kinase n=1 Tax=Seonamhaeicola sp. MEBiC01930 TaxID=2976768 RepID=UPI0032506CEE
MNLIIDVGNSYVKLAVFNRNGLKHRFIVEHNKLVEQVTMLIEEIPSLKRGVLSSVGKLTSNQLRELKDLLDLLIIDSKTALPFINTYETPKTLGVDRIALVCASINEFSESNVLIIDAGTCITYDFINEKNEYLGGAISPGIRVRYKSLNNLTANLPLLETELPRSIIGCSTEESIHSGVVNGVLKEIDGVIEDYKCKYSDLTVILTGGDANFLSKQLKSSIFANSNFLLEGLNFILQFNLNE